MGNFKAIQRTEEFRIMVSPEEKELYSKIHFQKIDMSDEIFVININGYIGYSTGLEIKYANSTNKPVKYLEPCI